MRNPDREHFRHVIGHFASGVAVITAKEGEARYGATISAICSLSLDPPMIVVCINRSAETCRAIERAGRFGVSILAAAQSELAYHFASKSASKFDGIEIVETGDGQPILREALAQLDCRVVRAAVGGTHTVFIASVQGAEAREGEPLTYFRGAFGRFSTELKCDA